MRFSIIFEINKSIIALNYQKLIISILKKCFQLSNKSVYEIFYNSPKIKPFTFSVYFPESKFEKNKIKLGNKNEIILNFSTYNTEIGLLFYNGLLEYVKKGFYYKDKEFQLRLKSVILKREYRIKTDRIKFKTLSPIIVRHHIREKNKDEYLTLQNSDLEKFENQLNVNMSYVFKEFLGKEYKLKFKPEAIKSVPIKVSDEKFTKGYIPANIGTFYLEADIEALDFVYKAGLGARRSFGFGMIEVVKEE